ncbi:unnamed protein product [Parnassius apollo]|uniref:(apollo) hypothetical protein n=1 Tax=Parnassius apollo TaxID=110799 RepID=A0A8S3XEH2_PARAO|nr:unnamed protein product [Parnassius apollo]
MSDAQQLLRCLLDTIATENDYKDYETKLQLFSTGGANYTSQLHHITLSAPEKDDLKLFAKLAIVNENIRAQARSEIFETEMFFYSELLKQFQDMENQHNVPSEHRLATAKYYGCNREYLKEILILEDLSSQGFDTLDRLKSFDWNYASKSVTELSKLHALSIAYSKEHPEEFDALYTKFKLRTVDNPKNKHIMEGIIRMAMEVIKEENKAKVLAFLQKFKNNEFNKLLMPSRRPIIAHGDFRHSNLMHRTREDGQLEVVIVDYQTLQISNPIIDLTYFIFSGSDEEFRAKYYRQLLDHYYLELCNALTRLHINAKEVYPKEDFECELERIQPYGLMISLVLLPMVTVEAKNAPKMDGGSDINDFAIKPNELAATRLNGVINDFVRLGVL